MKDYSAHAHLILSEMRKVFVEDDLDNIEFVRVRGHSHLHRLVRGQPLLVCNLNKEVM